MRRFWDAVASTKSVACAVAVVAVAGWTTMVPHAQGKAAGDVFNDKCAVCHGADGAGKTAKGKKLKVKDVRETARTMTAEQMIEVVTKGKDPDMDAFGKDLSAAQIKEIVEYYRGLAKK